MRRFRSGLAVLALVTAVTACAGGAEDDATPLGDDLGATAQPVDGDADPDAEASDPDADDTASDDPTASDAPAPVDDTSDEPDDGSAAADASPSESADAGCTLTAEDAGIEVSTPAHGASVDETFTIAGCGNTFEATYLWEVELDDGTVAGAGFGTMSCGSGCVGTFEEDVTVEGDGAATLRVFEESAQDGSRVNVVEVPVTITP